MTLTHVALWFAALSLLSFALMYFDKRAAQNDGRRVPERTLLLWAFVGGGIGAKLAQNRFRHKTQKQPFRTWLNVALIVNGLTAIMLCVPAFRETVVLILLDALR